MATKACSVKNIQHGFIMTGQIEGLHMRFPVFDTILSTCGRNPKKEEYENIEKNMTNILYHSSEYGLISEDLYDQMGFGRCIYGSVNDYCIVRSARLGWDQLGTAVSYDGQAWLGYRTKTTTMTR
jgi:hypothetical protein